MCNLLLSLIYYLLSPGSLGMETSAKPFPSFQLNAIVDRFHSSSPKPNWLPLPLPAGPCPSQPPTRPPVSLMLLGMGWMAEDRPASFNWTSMHGFKTWSCSDGDNLKREKKGFPVHLSCYLGWWCEHHSLPGASLPQLLVCPTLDPSWGPRNTCLHSARGSFLLELRISIL